MYKLLFSLLAAAFIFSNIPVANATKMVASWYDCAKPGECSKSKRTASGKKFNPNAYTAAHRSLPFGTRLKVTHKGKSVIVVVNDRGPFIKGRHLDLSRAAARKIGCKGVCTVTVRVL